MKTLFKKIGWKEIYPDTLERLGYFKDAFRVNFTLNQISDDELEEAVVYGFGVYGQGTVYDILCVVKNLTLADSTLDVVFKDFNDAFKVLGEYNSIQPKTMINLFLEYLYSLHIKR